MALDRVAFARAVGLAEPDPWQQDLLRSTSQRVLLNCCRQSGKSTMAAVLALHQALYHSDSLVLCLAPALKKCAVCSHPAAVPITSALLAGQSPRSIVRCYTKLSRKDLKRHMDVCFKRYLARKVAEEEAHD
ncbi:MAG: hypothetical protein ICV68_16700 [Pyrinomonadaceae bacterium]|nr:hypothetical protein [Pyrinomonadaceae bacterium]